MLEALSRWLCSRVYTRYQVESMWARPADSGTVKPAASPWYCHPDLREKNRKRSSLSVPGDILNCHDHIQIHWMSRHHDYAYWCYHIGSFSGFTFRNDLWGRERGEGARTCSLHPFQYLSSQLSHLPRYPMLEGGGRKSKGEGALGSICGTEDPGYYTCISRNSTCDVQSVGIL